MFLNLPCLLFICVSQHKTGAVWRFHDKTTVHVQDYLNKLSQSNQIDAQFSELSLYYELNETKQLVWNEMNGNWIRITTCCSVLSSSIVKMHRRPLLLIGVCDT